MNHSNVPITVVGLCPDFHAVLADAVVFAPGFAKNGALPALDGFPCATLLVGRGDWGGTLEVGFGLVLDGAERNLSGCTHQVQEVNVAPPPLPTTMDVGARCGKRRQDDMNKPGRVVCISTLTYQGTTNGEVEEEETGVRLLCA